ncbi:MAG TPA: TetR/AcrR family transcriptional regulator [Acidimicrobiales bacterium]|nr:TetR/AcrR family transcriptional regulator [Acidimicrobiales bacterium]
MTEVSAPLPGDTPAAGTDADVLRQRLLQAAAAVFARQGYDGTKIMDIVRESGLSTGAVYGRFRSKNDLLREAIVTRSGTAARVGADGVERVADLITAVATHTDAPLTDAEALRLEAYVTSRREPEVAAALAESYDVFRRRLAPLVAEAQVDGTVGDDVDADAVLFLVRILSLGLLLHRGSGLPGPDADAWQSLVARLVASFGADAAPTTTENPDPTTGDPEDQR